VDGFFPANAASGCFVARIVDKEAALPAQVHLDPVRITA